MRGRDPSPPAHREEVIAALQRQRDGLLSLAMRLTRWDRARSEDLVQAAFLRAANAEAGAASWTYLRQALLHAFFDEQRSFWQRFVTKTSTLREIPQEDPIVERLHCGREAHALKDRLPKTEYLTLVMWAEGCSAKEICGHLGIRRSTYPHVLARAKKLAQEWLGRQDSARSTAPSPSLSATPVTE